MPQNRLMMIIKRMCVGLLALGWATSAMADGDRPITDAQLRQHIAILASDEFGGRAPGTADEIKTIDYISRHWAQSGLVSGTNDSDPAWLQPVALTTSIAFAQHVRVIHQNRIKDIEPEQFYLVGRHEVTTVNGTAVYVGFGVDASGNVVADVKGKIAVMLYDDPPHAADAAEWTRALRVAALGQAGATAVLTLAPDDWTWSRWIRVVKQSGTRLASDVPQVDITGYISRDGLKRLLAFAGVGLAKAALAASDPDFRGFHLPVEMQLGVSTQIQTYNSHNVIGRLKGAKPGAGAVILMGHWDHLGECGEEGDEDRICNGAVDNASGIAAMLSIADTLAKGPVLDRDIYFIATTAEEKGLLGAYHFAANPVVPLDDVILALNLDTIAVAPKNAPVSIIGMGETGFDSTVAAVAAEFGREMDPSEVANSYIRRQDGWALLQKGVPALMIGGSFADQPWLEAFIEGPYHGTDDELRDDSDLDGAVDDANLHVALLRKIADADFVVGPANPDGEITQ